MPDIYARIAAHTGILPQHFRVVASFGGGETSVRDFAQLADAKTYADDVAAEYADQPQLAYVYDSDFVRIYEGRPYYMK